jgi:hypothetical protein
MHGGNLLSFYLNLFGNQQLKKRTFFPAKSWQKSFQLQMFCQNSRSFFGKLAARNSSLAISVRRNFSIWNIFENCPFFSQICVSRSHSDRNGFVFHSMKAWKRFSKRELNCSIYIHMYIHKAVAMRTCTSRCLISLQKKSEAFISQIHTMTMYATFWQQSSLNTLEGFEPGIFCSVGGREDPLRHAARAFDSTFDVV